MMRDYFGKAALFILIFSLGLLILGLAILSHWQNYFFYSLKIIPIIFLLLIGSLALLYYRVQSLTKKIHVAEKKIRTIHRFQQTIQNAATYMIISTDQRGIIKTFNKAAEEMLGYQANEVVDKVTPGIFHDPELIKKRAKELSAELGYEVKGMEVFTLKPKLFGAETREWIYIRKDGSSYPALLTTTPLYNEQGEWIGSVSIGIDITERKNIDKMKHEFISVISQELKTRLTAILASLNLLSDNVGKEWHSENKELLAIAKRNSESLVRLINDVVDTEKIESGHLKLKLQTIKIDDVVQEAIVLKQSYAEKCGTSIKLIAAQPDVSVVADHDRLLQAITNLLANAIESSFQGERVTVAITQRKNKVRIAINNKGPGIPKELKKRIFQKFMQTDSSSLKFQNTGLSLAISKGIIELLNGNINFVSKYAEGTTFYFDLPIVHEKEFIA